MTKVSSLPNTPPEPTAAATVSRAVITRVLSRRRVELRLAADATLVTAAIAAYRYDDPLVGDEVLLLGDDEERFVVGVLRALREAGDRHEARDARGRLLFRHDPTTGTNELFVSPGDLNLAVPEGQLELSARDGVRIKSDASVELTASGADREATSTLRLDPERIGASTDELDLAAGRAVMATKHATFVAERLESTVTRLQQTARVIETRAQRIVERSKTSYREVEQVAQIKAGRLRSIAQTSAQLLSDRILLKSKRDTKIRGEKIHLA